MNHHFERERERWLGDGIHFLKDGCMTDWVAPVNVNKARYFSEWKVKRGKMAPKFSG